MSMVLLLLLSFYQGDTPPETEEESMNKVSYILGHQLGNGIHQQKVEVSIDHILEGLTDGLQGKGKYDQAQMTQIMRDLQNKLRAKAMEERNKQGGVNQATADKFLAENKTKEGVVTLPSGLQYQIMRPGTGEKPASPETKVKVHYLGTRLSGEKFDSSYDKGTPVTFALNGVIKGWTEGVQLMKLGAKWKFFVPPSLGYGANPRPGGTIQANDLLIFEIELLEIMP